MERTTLSEFFKKKNTTDINFDQLNICVNRFRPEVIITRSKEDPGAIHMVIATKGGVVAILRYAYSKEAMKSKLTQGYHLFNLHAKYNTLRLVIGNVHGSIKDETDDGLLDMLFAIMSTNSESMNYYDRDGFLRLIRRYHYSYHAEKFGDDPKKVNYDANVKVICHGIRDEHDEEVIAIVDALTIWGNKVNVHYANYEPHRVYSNSSANNTVIRNHGMIDAMNMMEDMGIPERSIDRYASFIAESFERIDEMPEYKPNRRRKNNDRLPVDDYAYPEDYFF